MAKELERLLAAVKATDGNIGVSLSAAREALADFLLAHQGDVLEALRRADG